MIRQYQSGRIGGLQGRVLLLNGSSWEPLAVISVPRAINLVLADKAVTHEMLVRLGTLAREAGISEMVLATLPRVSAAPASPSAQ